MATPTLTAPTSAASVFQQLLGLLEDYESSVKGDSASQLAADQQSILTQLETLAQFYPGLTGTIFGANQGNMVNALATTDPATALKDIQTALPSLITAAQQYVSNNPNWAAAPTFTAAPDANSPGQIAINQSNPSFGLDPNQGYNPATGLLDGQPYYPNAPASFLPAGQSLLPPNDTITTQSGGTVVTGADGSLVSSTDAQGNNLLGGSSSTDALSFGTAEEIINSALATVGLDPNQVSGSGSDAGQTLASYFWGQIVNQGLTDPTTIGDMISVMLPSTGQFQVAFPGYQEAITNGYVRTVAEYVAADEGIVAVLIQGGVPKDLITPTTVGNLIAGGNSVNEVASKVTNIYDAVETAPAEVQNFFASQFGAQGPEGLARVVLDPTLDPVELTKMLASAQVRGALAAQNLNISVGLSERLADMGETYSDAKSKAANLAAQSGLFQQTVGEAASQVPVRGTINADTPLTEANQGVEAAFGLSGTAMQQVHQAVLDRLNEFKGGGGASTTEAEGYSGLAAAKPY